MFGYCPGCDDVLADIGPGEGSAWTASLLKCGPSPRRRESSKNCNIGEGMMDETAPAHPRSRQQRGLYR